MPTNQDNDLIWGAIPSDIIVTAQPMTAPTTLIFDIKFPVSKLSISVIEVVQDRYTQIYEELMGNTPIDNFFEGPSIGATYYNSTDRLYRVWTGTRWEVVPNKLLNATQCLAPHRVDLIMEEMINDSPVDNSKNNC